MLLGLSAAPASAHTISGPKPTNYRSRVVAIAPSIPGISARVVDLGNKLEVTNRTPTEITVLGYEGEPYLRIGPAGVFENLHSQATYINRTRQGSSVPPGVNTAPDAVPEWKKISSGHSTSWHDHNIHWMQAQPPPEVAQSPGSFHHLSQRNVIFRYNDQRVAIAVALDWVAGPSGLPWIAPLVGLFLLGLLAVVVTKWWRLLPALLVVVVGSDIAHAIAFEIPRPGGNLTKVLQFFGGNFVSIAVWAAAVPTVVALVRRRTEALYGVVFVGLLVALIGGATDLAALWKSQLPDAGPPWLTRLEVVVALGLGSGLVVGALFRMARSRAAAPPAGEGRWLSLLVSGLSDAELDRIARDLDTDEVLEVAFRDLATRAAPVRDAFAAGPVAFVVLDEDPVMVWTLGRSGASDELRALRGQVEAPAAEIRAPFTMLLQLLAGTVLVDDARAGSRLTTTGDGALIARLGPYLAEHAPLTMVEGSAPAS
ncbi:MAG: hypothetical protein QOI08_1862 [Actinomycetota bacterium]|nr:hypothetical protein [Actinomycetota bacterium]